MLLKLKRYLVSPSYRSAGLTFLLMSILFAFWVTRLPEVRDRLQLTEGDVGLALFFIPLGAWLAMLISHGVNRKYGEGRMMSISLAALALTSIFPLLAANFVALCGGLLFFGFTMGLTDISMNAVVSMLEKRDNVQIMATSHGFFSLGGIIGATIGSLIGGLGIPASIQMVVTALIVWAVIVTVIWPSTGNHREIHSDNDEPLFAIPRGGLIPLAIMSFCTMMAEGSVADWSAIFLDDVVKAPMHLLGFGYAAFSLTMTLGRFYGDELSRHFGPRRVLIFGCLIAIAGFMLTLVGGLYLSLIGFAAIGAGFSSIIPVIFSTAGAMKGFSSSYGIASVASAGYVGFLLGPVLIGLVAEVKSLTISFILLAVLTFAALILAWLKYPKAG